MVWGPGRTSNVHEAAQTESCQALAAWKELAKRNINPAFARHPGKEHEIVNAIEKVDWDHERMTVEDVTTQSLYGDAMESFIYQSKPSVRRFVDVCPPNPSVLEALRIMNGFVLPPEISAQLQDYGLDPDACCNPDLDDEQKVLLEQFEIKYVGDDRFGPLDLRISRRRRNGGEVKKPLSKRRKLVNTTTPKPFSLGPHMSSPRSKIEELSTWAVCQNVDDGYASLNLRKVDSQARKPLTAPEIERQDSAPAADCTKLRYDRAKMGSQSAALAMNDTPCFPAIPTDVNLALDAISAKMADMRAAIAVQQQGQKDSIRDALRPLHQAVDTIHKSTKATMEAAEMIKVTLEKLDRDLALGDGLRDGQSAAQG
ncbi:hypothetical protein Ct61P_13025 [Colletotrichum tofieldiae]|nr:hypothetical protein Ct61P_13025 [Colletotrichum tofieldiae]